MSGGPFGFRPEDDDEGHQPVPREGGSGMEGGGTGGPPGDPLGIFAAMGGAAGGAPDLGAMLQHLGRMLSWKGGPVNWDLARQSARQVVQAAGDRSVGDSDRRAVEEAFRLAEVWLDEATAFPSRSGAALAWSRAEWVEATLPGWQGLVEPVAARVSEAMQRTVPTGMAPEMTQMMGPLLGMVQQLGVTMWGAQVGQAIGRLATEVVGSTDVGLPLAPEGRSALLPANARTFGAGLGLEERDVLVYLALRESAHLRLFAHAPWLRPHLISLVEEYARHVEVDTDRIEASLRDLDPQRPEAIQEALEGGLFDMPTTPAQQAALDRLELALALVEGWVDDVVTQATQGRLPAADALRETVRRRRATGGPAEQTFATLVGLQLRPRRLREASGFWAEVRVARGIEGRDAVWAHPDLAPTADDLTDPEAFLHGGPELDVSAFESPGPRDDSEAGGTGEAEQGGPGARSDEGPEAGGSDAGGSDPR